MHYLAYNKVKKVCFIFIWKTFTLNCSKEEFKVNKKNK